MDDDDPGGNFCHTKKLLEASLAAPPDLESAARNYLGLHADLSSREETTMVCKIIKSPNKFESPTNKPFWKTCAGNLDSGVLSKKQAEAGNLKLLKAPENTVDTSAARGENLPMIKFAAMSMYSLLPQLEGLHLSEGQLVDIVPSRRPRISRTLGLYPFSAEPPIAENIHISSVYNQTQNKTHHQHITRAHPTSTPGGTLLSCLLQVVKAISTVIQKFFHLLETIPTNRTPRGVVFRPPEKLKTHSENKILSCNKIPQYNKMDIDQAWLADMDPDFLEIFSSSTEPVIFTGDFPVADGDSIQSINNVPDYAKDETFDHEMDTLHQPIHLGGTRTSHSSITLDQTIFDPSMYVEAFDGHDTRDWVLLEANQGQDTGDFTPGHADSSSDREWLQFVTLSPTSSPPPASGFEDDMGISTCSTSNDVSPQSECLDTPTITPNGSPPSFPPSAGQPRFAPRRFICPECRSPKVFHRRCDLNKHLKTHSKHLSCEYATQGCLKKFSTQKDMKRHADSVHRGKKDYRCEICIQQGADGMFSRKDNLRDHQKRVHRIESN